MKSIILFCIIITSISVNSFDNNDDKSIYQNITDTLSIIETEEYNETDLKTAIRIIKYDTKSSGHFLKEIKTRINKLIMESYSLFLPEKNEEFKPIRSRFKKLIKEIIREELTIKNEDLFLYSQHYHNLLFNPDYALRKQLLTTIMSHIKALHNQVSISNKEKQISNQLLHDFKNQCANKKNKFYSDILSEIKLYEERLLNDRVKKALEIQELNNDNNFTELPRSKSAPSEHQTSNNNHRYTIKYQQLEHKLQKQQDAINTQQDAIKTQQAAIIEQNKIIHNLLLKIEEAQKHKASERRHSARSKKKAGSKKKSNRSKSVGKNPSQIRTDRKPASKKNK